MMMHEAPGEIHEATQEIPGSIPGVADARMLMDVCPGGSVETDAHESREQAWSRPDLPGSELACGV